MKKTLLIILYGFIFQNTFCQDAYYDALKLRKYVVNGKFIIPRNDTDIIKKGLMQEYFVVLNSYYNDKFENPKKFHDVIADIEDNPDYNPFLAEFLSPGSVQSFINQGIAADKPVLSPKTSSLGLMNITNIADGIARFLIKRGKEELNAAFFNKLKKFLDNTEECRVLFPQSIEVFKNVKPYQYAEFIQNLREAFNKDLGNLVVGLNELVDLPKYQSLLKDLPEIRLCLRSAKMIQELSQSDGGILPDSIITQLAALSEWGEIDVNLGNSWKLLSLISQSVRDSASLTNTRTDTVLRRWITLSDMNRLIKDPVTLRIFLGLVYQKAGGIYFKTAKNDSTSVRQFMNANRNNILTIASLVENFVILANDIDRSIKDLKDKQKSNLSGSDDYYTYINKAINIMEYGFKAANTVYKFKIANSIQIDLLDNPYIVIAKNGNELYKNIYSKNYNNAVMNAYSILDMLFNHRQQLAEEKIKAGILDSTGAARLKASVDSIKVLNSKTIEAFLKYGNFMASVIKAESGEEVQEALEAAALPAGSYSIKQKSAFNCSVNGYIGYAWDLNKDGVYANGIYAPVGFSFNAGSNKKYGVTFSAFVSLIDVGSIATYRLQDDSTKTLKQEVRLESIFSPSAQLFIEPIRNFPLAVGAGWRRTPKLFYSGNNSFTTISSRNVFNISVLIDIPVFTIANKSFEKK